MSCSDPRYHMFVNLEHEIKHELDTLEISLKIFMKDMEKRRPAKITNSHRHRVIEELLNEKIPGSRPGSTNMTTKEIEKWIPILIERRLVRDEAHFNSLLIARRDLDATELIEKETTRVMEEKIDIENRLHQIRLLQSLYYVPD